MTPTSFDESIHCLASTYGALLAMALSLDIDDQERALSFLGLGDTAARDYEEALRKLRVAHDTCQAAGQLAGQAAALELLGSAAEEHGDAELATRRYKEALFIYLAVGSVRGHAVMDRLASLASHP
ncbi:hypothetical protein [Streptomyces chartreusis]|uniref:hypothetical protein n=1 Tax=Streptomyces chartreusis TaxID=1969 RepID=UPI00362A84CA